MYLLHLDNASYRIRLELDIHDIHAYQIFDIHDIREPKSDIQSANFESSAKSTLMHRRETAIPPFESGYHQLQKCPGPISLRCVKIDLVDDSKFALKNLIYM